MKTLDEILQSCPIKDNIVILYNNEMRSITEEQFRWLQLAINKEEIDHKSVQVVLPNSQLISFDTQGKLTEDIEAVYDPELQRCVGYNTLSLNVKLSRELFIHCKDDDK